MDASLDTGVKVMRNVAHVTFGSGSLGQLDEAIERVVGPVCSSSIVCLIDYFFSGKIPQTIQKLVGAGANSIFVDSSHEPTTQGIDELVEKIRNTVDEVALVIAFGGGSTLDTGKAVSNLLTNGGQAADYQGWDLVKRPGVPKIGIPTLSGTGAEATRTCVMTNPATGLKLGMNSDHTVFDFIILDPLLSATVPREQYFFTGMDAYIHCAEALGGTFRNAIGDALSRESLRLCERVFSSEDMMSLEARQELMVASYLGGCAIATTYVGLIHPFSAGLSVVLGIHHCLANCIALRALSEFYPEEARKMDEWASKQGVSIPFGIGRTLTQEQLVALEAATIVHQKPLTNALGPNYRETLTSERVHRIFLGM